MANVVEVAKQYERRTKEFGQPYGALGQIALEVLEVLDEEGFVTGALTYSFLQEKTKRSNTALSLALKNLVEHGFLEKGARKSEYTIATPEEAMRMFDPKDVL